MLPYIDFEIFLLDREYTEHFFLNFESYLEYNQNNVLQQMNIVLCQWDKNCNQANIHRFRNIYTK